jgi:hypothetical protein
MTTQQLIVGAVAYSVALAAVVYFTRPTGRRLAGSLVRACELYVTCVAKPGGSLPGGDWPDRIIGEILRREAEALLLDPTFPADPFAP